MRRVIVVLVLLATATGCDIPRDPENTLELVSGETLRAGLIASEPWASLEDGEPSGIEVELVEAFAAEIDASVEWFDGAESDMFGALHEGELDVVVGGITSQSPFGSDAALTHPYLTTQTVVGFPDEPGIDDDVAGLEVAVEAGSEAAGLLEKTDAVPVEVADITAVDGPRVVENWMLDDLSLIDLGVQLDEVDHVMAVRMGENAFMVRLERFLLANEELVTRLLEEAQP